MKKTFAIFGIILLITFILFSGYIFKNKFSEVSFTLTNEETFSLDNFYSYELTKPYKDIRNLPQNYTKEDAQLDNCFIVNSAISNNYLYSQFMSDYTNSISSFIRVVKFEEENNIIIYDVLYDANLDKLFIVTDNTRNNASYETENNISTKSFEQTGEYRYNNFLYWVTFNGDLNSETFESNNALIITQLY